MPIHGDGAAFGNAAHAAIDAFGFAPLATPVVSAHVMGGARSPGPRGPRSTHQGATTISRTFTSSTDRCSRHRSARIRASIYGLVARLATGLATAPRREASTTAVRRARPAAIRVFALMRG
jgi:hypothetical protein